MFGFSDLEERLLSADGATVATDALRRLHAIRDRVEERKRAGLPSAEFADAERLLAALVAAERILLDTSHLRRERQ